ncbi:MAG: N-acetylornithine carbamoyltransferase [Pseudomonadota bacterium]
MRHFLTTEDWSRAELQAMLDDADAFRRSPVSEDLKGRKAALVFFNPSLRTRTSFQIAMADLGGDAIVLDAAGTWPLETEPGAVMDGEAEEHVKEAARVLSRYCDLICVRAFPKFQDWSIDRQDLVLRAFAEHAEVPVVNMETIVHPCQELALMRTIEDRLGGAPDGKKFVLTWTYHPRPLNTAVANSALLVAAKFGMDVTLLCPTEEYRLDPRFMERAEADASAQGRSIIVTHDIEEAYSGAHVVYAKSWGALPYFGRWEDEKPIRDAHKHFIVDEEKMAMTDGGLFSHCLPMRRNVKATDAVADAPYSMIIDEAENRLHVQKAMLKRLARELS